MRLDIIDSTVKLMHRLIVDMVKNQRVSISKNRGYREGKNMGMTMTQKVWPTAPAPAL